MVKEVLIKFYSGKKVLMMFSSRKKSLIKFSSRERSFLITFSSRKNGWARRKKTHTAFLETKNAVA